MAGKNCLAVLLTTAPEVEEAVQKLERAGYDLDAFVSVLGRIFRAGAGPEGEHGPEREGKKPRQPHHRYCRKFDDFALFPNTMSGQIAVCGPLVGAMLDALRCEGAGSDAQPALVTALAEAGIPEQDIGRYEIALARGHILLLVTAPGNEVDRAAEMLATGGEIGLSVHRAT